MVKDGVLITPNSNILLGITRQKLLTIAKEHVRVEERLITLDELIDCQEAFIASTTKQVLPVSAIDDKVINDGKPGPITRQLYKELVEMQLGASPSLTEGEG